MPLLLKSVTENYLEVCSSSIRAHINLDGPLVYYSEVYFMMMEARLKNSVSEV